MEFEVSKTCGNRKAISDHGELLHYTFLPIRQPREYHLCKFSPATRQEGGLLKLGRIHSCHTQVNNPPRPLSVEDDISWYDILMCKHYPPESKPRCTPR